MIEGCWPVDGVNFVPSFQEEVVCYDKLIRTINLSYRPTTNGHRPEKARFKINYTMTRVAFKMKLFPGFEEEYKKRHDTLWPELQQLLKNTGISEYSIFLDESTNDLFGVLKIEDPEALKNLRTHPVMQRWWKHMGDIMESNPDNSPLSIPLKEVFYLP